MSAPFHYARQGRSARTAGAVIAIWLGLVGLWIGVEASPWIIGFLALFTLPACWDLVTNPPSGLDLSGDRLSFFYGRRQVDLALDEIDYARFDTRLDMSVRVTFILENAEKLRLPYEATPPHLAFESALNARGVTTKRFHFQFWQ